jgi:serine protease Do
MKVSSTSTVCLVLALLLFGDGCAAAPPKAEVAAPKARAGSHTVVNDLQIRGDVARELQVIREAGKTVPMADLRRQLEKRAHHSLSLPRPARHKWTPAEIYRQCRRSVVVVSGLYKCDKCGKWHGSTATGFFLTSSGAVATNYHVIAAKDREALGVRTLDGKVYPVREVLAANKEDDVAIIRIDGRGFKPLPLVPDADVGSPVAVISHPDSRFYALTTGIVSRYFATYNYSKRITRMAITAEFAKGSSGAPVIDEHGSVVGMVASTRSTYYKQDALHDKRLQMVMRYCVPTQSILNRIE